ncbi:hypothetical protein [Spirosoma flavum]|uniref:Uncharacterized protein n=1 Tax=Spirosoma flavum TaxID=2048557 RepID=A0ABW6AGK7_9BACT
MTTNLVSSHKTRRILTNHFYVYGSMRYIVVFAQQEIGYAVGFDHCTDAVDFLFWGYEEYELLPYGIYDILTGDALPYEHRGERTAKIDEPVIRQIALDYVKSAIRQTT